MAKLEMTFEHGQTREIALRNFERGIGEARRKFPDRIHAVEGSLDRQSARIRGTGYDILLEVDDHNVHARGSIPFFAKVFEAPVRQFIMETFRRPLPDG